MERMRELLMIAALALVCVVLVRLVVQPPVTAVSAAATTPAAPPAIAGDKLTNFQRGQLINGCYQMTAPATAVLKSYVDACLEDIAKIP